MPKPARMPKEIKAPPELTAAAEAALKQNLKPLRAAEILKYEMYRLSMQQTGDLTAAGLRLGMSRSALQQAVALLEVRLT